MIINLQTFGAQPGSSTPCTAQLQAALDAVHDAGGGTVHIPAGDYITRGCALWLGQ